MFSDVNLVAVLVAAVVDMVIGALWYSPVLFAKPWMRLIGKKEDQMMKDMKGGKMSQMYGLTFIGALVLSFVLAKVLVLTGTMDIAGGLQMAFWLWLGFVATTSLPDYTFAGRPKQLFILNTGYYLVAMLVMSVILVSLK